MIIEIQPVPIAVSYLSSLLRIVQAALRETAFASNHINSSIGNQPILLASLSEKNEKLSIHLSFSDPKTNKNLDTLSKEIFQNFFQDFSNYVKTLPQPSLWGPKSSIKNTKKLTPSTLEHRLEGVYRELKRIPKSKISLNSKTISIEGFNLQLNWKLTIIKSDFIIQ